jgi:lipopolysaccharide biosynthesis glycosyltransferase
MKTCYATAVSAKYIQYAHVALKSLHDNGGLDIPMYIFYMESSGFPGTPENLHTDYNDITPYMEELKALYPNIIFSKIDYHTYHNNNKDIPHFWSIECFKIRDFDRVIWFDVDILCVKSLDDLPEVSLGMVYEDKRNQFNAGFMVIGKEYLNDATYGALLAHQKDPKTFGRDQAVYNEYFKKDQITSLHGRYNSLTPRVTFSNPFPDDLRIIHYIYKPDSTPGMKQLPPSLYKLWYDHANAAAKIIEGVK